MAVAADQVIIMNYLSGPLHGLTKITSRAVLIRSWAFAWSCHMQKQQINSNRLL